MSEPLEDYLETIYLLVQEHGAARVRDIARTRGVKAATVSIALGKLGLAGLVDYARREHIRLTPKGEESARRVLSRHRLLTRFFEEILGMSPHAASEQACSLEHALTDEATDRLVRFFEFLGSRPASAGAFGQCPSGARPGDDHPCGDASPDCARCSVPAQESGASLASLAPGQSAVVTVSPRRAPSASASSTWGSSPRRRSTWSERARAAIRSGSAARARASPSAVPRPIASSSAAPRDRLPFF